MWVRKLRVKEEVGEGEEGQHDERVGMTRVKRGWARRSKFRGTVHGGLIEAKIGI